MAVEEKRARLIELEQHRQELALDYASLSAQVEEAAKQRDERDAEIQRAKLALKQAREELAREEALQASRDQAASVYAGMGERAAELAAKAQEFEWAEGIMEHQMFGVIFGTIAKRWICGDEPGTGKTRQAVGWLDLVGAHKVVIVCEANVCDQFAGEVMDLAPHREVINLYNKSKLRRHELLDIAMSKEDAVIVVNYEIWRLDRELLQKLYAWHIDTVVVDEAHNLKNTATANYKHVAGLIDRENVCPACGEHIEGTRNTDEKGRVRGFAPCPNCKWKLGDLTFDSKLSTVLQARSVQNVMLLTGTPILNSPLDLFSLLHLVDPALFPMRSQYEDAYLRTNPFSKKLEFRVGALDMLKPLISGRFLARTKKDAGIELPPQHVHIIPVDLDPQKYPLQLRTIRQITEAAEIVLSDGKALTIMHLIALITRKRQANVWPGGIEVKHPETGEVIFSVGEEVQESAKLDAIVENILRLNAEGRRQVVFSQFKTGLAELERRLLKKRIRVVRLDGDTPMALRKRIKTNFYRDKDETPEWDVVLANYKTGGTGLNLTSAVVTHIFDEEWNPGKRTQAYDRTHRIGQTESTDVFVYRIPRTIDTWMSNIITRKERMVESFRGTMLDPENQITPRALLKAMKSGEML